MTAERSQILNFSFVSHQSCILKRTSKEWDTVSHYSPIVIQEIMIYKTKPNQQSNHNTKGKMLINCKEEHFKGWTWCLSLWLVLAASDSHKWEKKQHSCVLWVWGTQEYWTPVWREDFPCMWMHSTSDDIFSSLSPTV